ncbi:MAG: hypothetical protein HS132_13685 [Planctomycetia bacterium]|nr:hypothetical protein [Planctomycetia bacterium]
MKPINHFGVSVITGVATFLATRTISPSIACFLIGWLVDVDHIWDFYANGCRGFSIKRFGNAMDNGKIKRASFYFHSYELLLLLVSLCFITHFNYLLSFATLGFAIHLFLDQICNPVKPLTYFLTYRILNDCKTEIIFKINPKLKAP